MQEGYENLSACTHFLKHRNFYLFLCILAEVKKKQLVRCPSHNAYKCLGECGKKNCNTHFQTEKGLQEHIVNSHSVCQEVIMFLQ